MFVRISCVLVTLTAYLFGLEAKAQDSQCIFAANQAATVLIEYTYDTPDGTGVEKGTGFIISPEGYVVTNSHVVSPRLSDVEVTSSKVSIRPGGLLNPAVEAAVLTRDPMNDLALLKLPNRDNGLEWPAVAISADTKLPIGSPLIGLGFSGGDISLIPAGQKTTENTFIGGELRPWWQTNLGLNSGNSGGPVFGELGTVVGVAVAVNNAAQLITYVIPIGYTQHLLDAANVSPVQAGRCAVFPECRHESHGLERYEVDAVIGKWGEWRKGGYNRGAFCNDFLSELRNQYPRSTFTFVRDDERSQSDVFRNFEYQYYCEYRRQEQPVYISMRSIACLR